ncbi:LANO_0H11936g1_1 [Lachancea nothofagi CBS 11611]|uniref:HECT-type E3 ubiquitin transferase n=1 Tax=Lachancea nothofagi CBS 11611 TaxID=1266666 RepID=A0A1G4KMD5_9SACH|nr:LANO_0H11936g1_1 [Lachancea nothofagi CBS 11611]
MVTLTKLEKVRKEERAKEFKPLIDDLTKCSEQDFIQKLTQIVIWDRSRDDLYTWIPVLNRIDDFLNKILDRYSYKSSNRKTQPVKLTIMSYQDEMITKELLWFSCRLLNNTCNRSLYSSLDVMSNLLNCPNYRVKLGAMKVIAIMGEQQVIARQKIDNKNLLGNKDLKRKALDLALALPSSTTDDSMDHFALVDLYFDKKKFPSKWSKLNFSYYTSTSKPHLPNKPGSGSLKQFVVSSEEISSLSLQQLFDRGMSEIPSEKWFDFSLQATIAKAFCDNNFENLEMRNLIIQTKFNAMAFVNAVYIPAQVSSQLFEIDPYAFNNLTDFISLSERKLPKDLRMDALFCLECVSLKHIWCSDIVRNLGGNMSHGLLFQILRYIAKLLRDKNSEELDEEYNVRFFYLVSNLADVKALQESMLTAGLIPNLLEVISIKDSPFKRTLASATHLLEVFIDDADATTEFISNNGFNILIECVNEEVNFALDHPEFGEPPKYPVVYYSISFRQLGYIRSLLKLVLKLLKTDSGDRIRNLIDSPILVSLNKILENRPVFGYTLVTYALDVVQTIINTEPTIYPILVESKTIPYIFDNFKEFLGPSGELLSLLPEVISALCLNTDGLKQVKDKNLINYLFDIMKTPELAKILSWEDSAIDIGTSIDELARHYPDLKPTIEINFEETIKTLPIIIKFSHPYVYKSVTGSGEFYHSKEDKIVDNEENSSEIEGGAAELPSSILDCFSAVFYGMTLENVSWASLADKIDIKEMLAVVIPERPPFDYVGSQTLLNFSDILKLFDDERRNYALPALLSLLSEKLNGITEFLDCKFEKSYVLSTPYDELEETLRKLSVINVILYVITDIYINIASLFPIRVLQVMEFFEHNGFDLISKLRLLFQRSSLEEMYIRERLPEQVASETTVRPIGNTPPLTLYANKPKKSDTVDDKTSAKFKNTLQERHLFVKMQSWVSMLFRCFLRMTHARKMTIEAPDRALEIRIFDTTVNEIVNMMDLKYLESHLSYFLVIFNFNTFVFTFPNVTTSVGGTIQTIPVFLFYQAGGFKIYFDAIKSLFAKLQTFDNVEDIEKYDYVKDSDEVLTASALINALSFYNKSIQMDTMENIRNTKEYYPYDEVYYNLTIATIVPVKILALGMVDEVTKDFSIFDHSCNRLPYSVFKQLLSIVRNVFNSSSEGEDHDLYELRWDLMPPSHRKIEMLKACGVTEDIAKGYLEEQKDDLPIHVKPDIFSDSEWDKFKALKESGDWKTDLRLLEPQYRNFSSVSDLNNLRLEFYSSGFEDRILQLLPSYPKLINAISHMILQILKEVDESPVNIVGKLMDMMRNIQLNNAHVLAPIIHLFGILLNNKGIYDDCEHNIEDFVTYLKDALRPEYVNSAWFSKALYVYEIVFAKSEAPKSDESAEVFENNYNVTCPPIFTAFEVSPEAKGKIFNSLIRVDEITDFYSALAISRILILYTKDQHYAYEVTQSGILSKLLKTIGVFQRSDKINYLESSFLLLARRCFENAETVKSLIQYELSRAFTTRAIGDSKEKPRDLSGLVSEKANIVMRDPNVFVNCVCETARFEDFENPESLQNLSVRRIMTERDEEMSDVTSQTEDKLTLSNRTGIVHLLLSQLMAAYKKDWTSEPPREEDSEDVKKKDVVNVGRNPVCAYIIFLLKVLIELIGSYKQSKLEFLTFNKRNLYVESPKPRTTALNFVLYQLLDTESRDQDKHYTERKEVVGKLARDLVVSFVSSVQDQETQKKDPKTTDPDMTYIRKFTIESVTKALKTTTKTTKSLEANVGKLYGWLHLITSFLLTDRSYLHSVLDSNKTYVDKYQIGKLMIDMNVPSAIGDCMASLDLNYPFSKRLFNKSIEPLNAMNEIRSRFSELFKIENTEEDDDVEDESEKEEHSDMFKNSALGMYDVEDIEDDEDDDASLIGEDEDIAFVEGENGEIEVVFSEDEHDHHHHHHRHHHNESDGSDSHHVDESSDSDESMDYDSEDDVDIDIGSGPQSSNYDRRGGHDDIGSEDSSYYTENEDSMNFAGINDDVRGQVTNVDLNSSELDESDWESGLSELSGSDEESSEDNYIDEANGGDRWLADEVNIEDDSDEEGRGIFSGIQHVFSPEPQYFRIHGHNHGSHRNQHNHGSRRSDFSMVAPSISLLNGNRRTQSILMNPLGPSGLEEIENGIINQLNSSGNTNRLRNDSGYLSDVLFSGEFFDEKSSTGIVLKSTTARWNDIYEMFYDSKVYVNNVIPTIVGRIFPPSSELYLRKRNEALEKDQEHRKKREEGIKEAESKKRKVEEVTTNDSEDSDRESEGEQNHEDLEPIMVDIAGEQVDIAGTDIDPEFLNALPDEMRAEVFAQHIRERRAEAFERTVDSREIDTDFLDTIPENLREEILEQEAAESRFSRLMSDASGRENDNSATEDAHVDQEDDTGVVKKKAERTYFSPLVDRSGISALMRSLFISQPYLAREAYHELFFRLCSSKQNRSDIMNILMLILTEGINDHKSLEKVYNLISNRALGIAKSTSNRMLPVDCTPLSVANQTIEVLQNLVETENRLKFFFITEHENLLINKSPLKSKKDIFTRNMKWPINYLFSLFDKKIITDESVLLDLLTRILQIITKPISTIAKSASEGSQKKFTIPDIERKHLEAIVSIIRLDACNTKVFQQTLNIMTNLSTLKGTQDIFTEELCALAIQTVDILKPDLNALNSEICEVENGTEINYETIQKFTVHSSDQAKLLKVLTAIDYLYTNKKKAAEIDVDKLMGLYDKIRLGGVWTSLGHCLEKFEKRPTLSSSANILLPLIESLMVVCKHSKVRDSKDTLKYEEKKSDFSEIAAENTFFAFTDLHKKLLNQMIRSNPKLMSGPFALLVKNPRILDFDNKRYYFIAKVRTNLQEKPKLSISVRREQVFLDSYRSLFFKSNEDIKNSKLEITFKGEAGVDAGGVTREWYQVLSRQMFNPDYALFLPVASDKTTFHPNRTSGINPEHLSFFKFIGMIIGKAICDQCFLDCHFSREVYKNILSKPVALKDMESLDLDYYKSLIWILENDITDIIEETFSVETDDYGEHTIVDLTENGRDVLVTEKNKQDYVKKIVEFKLHTSVKEQMDNFLLGFYAIIPKELISVFDEQELELLISGLPDIDVDDWKNNTNYINYTPTCKQISYFWRAVRSFDCEERAKLLQFVTGTSKVPLSGFKELTGVNGISKFSIHRDYGATDRLPSSHTCFNQLDLPAYDSYEQLRGSVLLAINEGHEGFGIA